MSRIFTQLAKLQKINMGNSFHFMFYIKFNGTCLLLQFAFGFTLDLRTLGTVYAA